MTGLDLHDVSALRPLSERAPNAHNTQPWRLAQDGPAVEVGWHPARRLGPSDPTGRDLRLSLGAYVETSLVVAAGAGLALAFEPDFDDARHRVGRFVVPGPGGAAPPEFGIADLATRRTWRGRWDPVPMPDGLHAALDADCRAAGARLAVLGCAALRPLLGRADRWFFTDPGIVAELRNWSRLRPRHPRYHVDGLTDRALGLRPAEALALQAALGPRTHRWGRRLGLARLLAATHQQSLAGDGPVLALLTPRTTGGSGEVDLGRLLTRLWLRCGRAGFAAHPQSHLIDCPGTGDTLAALAGVTADTPERVVWVARVGRPAGAGLREVPLSPRIGDTGLHQQVTA